MKISDTGFLVPESFARATMEQTPPGGRILKAYLSNARIIGLPNGHRVRIREYCAGWKWLKIMAENPEIKAVGGFADNVLSPKQTLMVIRQGVHDRINRYVFHYNKGRKWQSEYFWSCKRDQRQLHDNAMQRRIIYRFETAEAQRRFGHLVTTPEDFF